MQNIKTIVKLRNQLWANEISWDFISRWVSKRGVVLQQSPDMAGDIPTVVFWPSKHHQLTQGPLCWRCIEIGDRQDHWDFPLAKYSPAYLIMKKDKFNDILIYRFIRYCKDSLQERHPISLTRWGRDKIASIFQTTFSNGFSWMKLYEFRLKFHWGLFPGVELTIFQHWFR